LCCEQFSSPENQNSSEDTHDELDFEFLGNVSGQPITLQTNMYLDGQGNREIRHYLPFDPTADFHKYSLLWNENIIMSAPPHSSISSTLLLTKVQFLGYHVIIQMDPWHHKLKIL
jgi:hypothetical protein